MAKDKKKDHARTKAKKEPRKRKAIAAAAASAVVDAPDPTGREPQTAKARVRPTRVAAPDPKPDPVAVTHQAAKAHVRPARVAAPERTGGENPAARRRPTRVAAPDPLGGEHHAAKAHGRATQVDTSLPDTPPELMALHAAARERRNAASLDSPDFRAAIMDL